MGITTRRIALWGATVVLVLQNKTQGVGMDMETAKPALVKGKNGLLGTISNLSDGAASQTGVQQVRVDLQSGQQFIVPFEVLQPQADGTYYLPFGLAELEQRYGLQAAISETEETIVIPVIAEELDIQKRQVSTGGVRLRKVVHERDEVIDQPLLEEEVNVERVTINQAVDQVPAVRYEGDTMIVPVVEEVVVVQKRLILKEELRITKRQVTVSHPQSIKLRSEEIIVEQIAPVIDAPAAATVPAPAPGADSPAVQPTSSI